MAKPVSPLDMTADTTIEEMYEGFNAKVTHHEVGSADYHIEKMIFASGALAAVGLINKAPRVQLALHKYQEEVTDLLHEYGAWQRRQTEEEDA